MLNGSVVVAEGGGRVEVEAGTGGINGDWKKVNK